LPASAAAVTAVRLLQPVAANGFPLEEEWLKAEPVAFCCDWQGRNRDPQRSTEVRLLWSADNHLFVRFRCRYREVHVFSDAGPNGRRHELWNRDVAEVFLQPDRFGEKYYKEFEVSPNGLWLDLDITPRGLSHITSGMRSMVTLHEAHRAWTADLAIPIAAVDARFHPARVWRANFFRCEGAEPERFYSAWQPTGTPQPNFHLPEKFGTLGFAE
jgi:cellulose/xylan binding protein with CBM9 domain